jgi:methylated-DNA-protein-cysteine methyltransferase-like protein
MEQAASERSYRERVLEVVRAIPRGKVTNYGTVALLAGRPRTARQVGVVLYGLRESDADVPWQRVVNAQGGISTFKVGHGELQIALLEAEGVEVVDRTVDLGRYGWDPGPEWAERQPKSMSSPM